ncbi:LysR family transcriptional regulator [Hydrogenophaga sp. D2P1]|uniref:LysR family transcriptional regulator n=1 Tax=Hydrogenophaga aromaticivorans TaxID=2610898 RepID=A0A7Y8GZY5_9BURK|nr:TOBE domain-containing protein [Hydrogenophaga aromaticivorans]NWF47946.1 LysR family transcriptional regulator [Hydrogenophaga aromaticivorans]
MTSPLHTALSEALGHAISDKRLEVLRRVGETGSISQAARDTGISYKAAWQAIDTLTNLSGVPLVERTVGGAGGGGARITPQGLQLLALADELAQAREAVLTRFAGGSSGLRFGLGLRTSMRNQLPCRVEAVESLGQGDPTVLVRLRTPGQALLTSSVTRESADLLGLRAGLEVLVLCKATAVRVGRDEVEDTPGQCVLPGRIERLARGQGRDEVVLALDGGGQWVGFAEHPSAARKGQRAWASMGVSSLVIGLAG